MLKVFKKQKKTPQIETYLFPPSRLGESCPYSNCKSYETNKLRYNCGKALHDWLTLNRRKKKVLRVWFLQRHNSGRRKIWPSARMNHIHIMTTTQTQFQWQITAGGEINTNAL